VPCRTAVLVVIFAAEAVVTTGVAAADATPVTDRASSALPTSAPRMRFIKANLLLVTVPSIPARAGKLRV
jgi:hypothetical protein